jgi:phosphate transport system substrate-binding protein
MLSKNFSRFTTLTALIAVSILPSGCGSGTKTSTNSTTTTTTAASPSDSASPAASGSPAAGGVSGTLSGAGATFPQPLYEKYSQEIRKAYPDLKINYQGIGSGGGIKQTISRTIDFGASDAAMTDEEIAKVPGGVVLVPTAGGAVSVVYNLPGVTGLKLSNAVLANIFAGKITKWDDPQIAKDNAGAKLPSTAIRPVVRADSSGTAFIFTNYISNNVPEFKTSVGASKEPKWPASFLKGKGNPGVAGLVKQSPGTIGFVEYDFGAKNQLTAASLQNKGGEYVAPSVATANQALADVTFPDNFRTFDINSPKGYPIVGLTWLLIPKQQKDPAKAQALKSMVKWMLTDGQKLNDGLNYTTIPAPVATRAIAAVETGVK